MKAPIYYKHYREEWTSEENEEANLLLQTYNWISTCFVQKKEGDVVAVTSLPSSGKITVLVVNNNLSSPSDTDKKNMTENFIEWNRAIQEVPDEGQTSVGLLAKRDTFLEGLTKTCWEKISHRIQKIIELDNKHTMNTYKILVENLEKAKKGAPAIDPPTALTEAARKLYSNPKAVNSVLEKYLQDLINMDCRAIGEAGRKRFFLLALSRAALIASAPILHDMHPTVIQFVKMSNFLKSFATRLQSYIKKLARYVTGAEKYVTQAFPLFKKLAQADGHNNGRLLFEVVWLQDLNNKSLKNDESQMQPLTVTNWFEGQVNVLKTDRSISSNINQNGVKKVKDELVKGMEDLKNRQGIVAFNNKIHCEIAMIYYLETYNIEIAYKVIGVSKLMCWPCDVFIKHFEAAGNSKVIWDLSGTSSTAHHQWRIPVANLFEAPPSPSGVPRVPHHPLQDKVNAAMKEFRKEMVNEFKSVLQRRITGNETRARTYSDSSAGSKWILSDDDRVIPEFSAATMAEVNK